MKIACLGLILLGSVTALVAEDWPQWGRGPSRNMVSPEKGLPAQCVPGEPSDTTGVFDAGKQQHIKWVGRLGEQTFGNPVVAGGKVYVGTNNDVPRDERFKGDYGIMYCFNEADGKFIWQLVVPKLRGGQKVDYEHVGICSSPAVDVKNGRVYVVTNRCEVLCLDVNGMANGNDGPFKDEGQYFAGPGSAPVQPRSGDADILWRYDMYNDLGIFPHYQAATSPLLIDGKIYVSTANSRDTTQHVPSPQAPALICLDAATGKLLGQEDSGISARTFHSNWSSASYGKAKDREMIVFGGGDGWCYAFAPTPVPSTSGGAEATPVLKELWRFNANPASRLVGPDGKPRKYSELEGPSEIIGTPVFHEGRVYVVTGRDPESGQGAGCLSCIDPSKSGNITQSGVVWRNERINRTMATVVVADGLLYVGDLHGMFYCIDIKDGHIVWKHDTEGELWGSALVADGKVYIGNNTGDVFCFEAGREKKLLGTSKFPGQVCSSAIVANGVLYVATEKHVFAIQEKK